MNERTDSIVLHFIAQYLMAPFILLFGFYVLVFGESGPGGGFQAGAIVGSALVLMRLTEGMEQSRRFLSSRGLLLIACAGVGIYAGVGLLALFAGQPFLDYSYVPNGWVNAFAEREHTSRALGVLGIEIGVFLAVAATLTLIFDYLMERLSDA
ncbi:MAG: cation:proton antiporter [SAR202 cluster bacterium]|nr:cation:proton antiporter [SAR202 cluster bacterium]